MELDGAAGEGGGQVLRSALALSMITGQPFRITHIRANCAKPGLMRQHLVAVQAAAQVSNASADSAELGSSELSFTPRRITGGDYHFAIGSAGSCRLVLQTVVLALLYAQHPSTVRITGGPVAGYVDALVAAVPSGVGLRELGGRRGPGIGRISTAHASTAGRAGTR